MVDIWKYAGTLPRVRLTTTEGVEYSGKVIDIQDAEEDESEKQDSLTLETDDGRIIGFYPSEIASINS